MTQARQRRGITLITAGLAGAAMLVAGTATATPAIGAARTSSATGTGSPSLRLLAAQRSITADLYGKTKRIYLDPGVWLESRNAPFQIDLRRSSYSQPLSAWQTIKTPWGTTERRAIAASMLTTRYTGLRKFFHIVAKNKKGKVAGSKYMNFCPNAYEPARASAGSALTSSYPEDCGSYDPFPVSNVWGIARGWAIDPALESYPTMKLAVGTYKLTESVAPAYAKLFHISAADSSVSLTLHVKHVKGCCSATPTAKPAAPRGFRLARSAGSSPAQLTQARARQVPLLSSAPKGDLPDLVPLPSWGITTSHVKKTSQDFLNFGATVWVGGNSPLDVEGFRQPGSPTMKAYQYFWHDGKVVGRTRAGTMGFDNKKGHHHWHFEQFARYVLLNSSKKLAVRSEKVGFCIAPTDAVDLLAPHADWNPGYIGLDGQCGVPTALWVQEYMPIGWGDTYDQYKAGQAFNITHLKDGTYYIEIIANPENKLHELTKANDVSLRKVIIGGKAGHRTVTVPAWHGIDPEKFPRK